MFKIRKIAFLFALPFLFTSCLNKFVESEDTKALEEEKNAILSYSQTNGFTQNAATGIYVKTIKPNAAGTLSTPASDFRISYNLKTLLGVDISSKSAADSVILNLYTSNLFRGFAESLLLLKEGERAQFIIPSALAYGTNPPTGVPNNSPILAEIELIDLITETEKIDTYIKKNAFKITEKTTSGLQFIRLNEPNTSAVALKDNDNIQLKYNGMFLNGKSFDSGTFGYVVGNTNLIKGFIESIRLLKKSEKGKFILPYAIAYGERGSGSSIPPYTPLVFDIEIVSVNGQ